MCGLTFLLFIGHTIAISNRQSSSFSRKNQDQSTLGRLTTRPSIEQAGRLSI